MVVVWSWWVKVRSDGQWMVGGGLWMVGGGWWLRVDGWVVGCEWVAIFKFIAKFWTSNHFHPHTQPYC